MDEAGQFLSTWKVRVIEVLPQNKGVQVKFAVEGRNPVRFRTRRFGIGKRGARSAALAKFADKAGFGDAKDLYRCICALPHDFEGPLFIGELLEPHSNQDSSAELRCVWPDENAA